MQNSAVSQPLKLGDATADTSHMIKTVVVVVVVIIIIIIIIIIIVIISFIRQLSKRNRDNE